MKQYWMERTERERLLLGIAFGLVALLLVWQFVYRPVADYHADAARSYEQAQERLEDMRRSAAEAAALMADGQGGEAAAPGGDLRTLAMTTARAKGLSVARLQPTGDDGLTLWIDGADTRLLYDWVVTLQREHAIVVEKASVSANDGAATVRAQLQLAGKGASGE